MSGTIRLPSLSFKKVVDALPKKKVVDGSCITSSKECFEKKTKHGAAIR